jgi:DNA-directed RNA polymerase beta' subunit
MSEVIKRELAHNVRSASKYIEAEHDEVWDILEDLTKKTRVLLKPRSNFAPSWYSGFPSSFD